MFNELELSSWFMQRFINNRTSHGILKRKDINLSIPKLEHNNNNNIPSIVCTRIFSIHRS